MCENISEMNSRMQKRLLKIEIVIWVSGRNVMTSPPFRCLHFFKPQQLLPLHQSRVLCGWQRSGGFFLTRGWLLLENDWHAAAFLNSAWKVSPTFCSAAFHPDFAPSVLKNSFCVVAIFLVSMPRPFLN